MTAGRSGRVAVVGALAAVGGLLAGCGAEQDADSSTRPGDPVAALDAGERGRFLLGRALFERVASPDEGLGPLYNGERCSDCHDQPAIGGGSSRILVLKATRYEEGRCDLLEAEGGDNIQQRVTEAAAAHGLQSEEAPASATATARVTAPPLFGLGLLEAVPDEALAAWEDPNDRDRDGISGRLPRTADGRSARFGRKGDAASVHDFVVSALRFELGFTTPGHLREHGPNGAPVPPAADPAPDPEIDHPTLEQLVAYVRHLAPPPPQRELSRAAADSVARGDALFRQIGCASCHRPTLETGAAAGPALARRTIHPYTDLLVHDLGPGLADVCGPGAAPGELRTAPLWGLRHRDRLLHDGRAATIPDAVSAHGGEAATARDAYLALPDEARAALIRFLQSL